MMKATKKTSNPNPMKRANILSRLFLCWIGKLMWTGYNKSLEQDDLYDVSGGNSSSKLGDQLERAWENELADAKCSGKEPRLLTAIIRCFGPQYTFCGFLLLLLNMVTKIAQPVLLEKIIASFTSDGSTLQSSVYIYSAGLVANAFLMNLLIHHSFISCSCAGMTARVACCSLVYRKVMRLSNASSTESKVAHLVSLISSDVDRFDIASTYLHYLWIGPLQVLLITYILWTYVGNAAFVGIAFIFLQTIPIQSFMSKLNAQMRYNTAMKTDERVRLINEVVTGVQVIKMYAWEKPFANLVATARKAEISIVRKACYLRGVNMSFEVFTERTSLFCILLTYTLFGNTITSNKVFSIAQFFNVLNGTLATWIPYALLTGAESQVTIDRLQKFLMEEERPRPTSRQSSGDKNSSAGQIGVSIAGGTAAWKPAQPAVLTEISLRVMPGSLCAVIGPIGSGKSSLLHAILRELPLYSGSMQVDDNISYASQEPWLFVGSVRQNILFGQPFDRKKYDEVVRVCALQRDLELFPYGDKTIVGERGVSLSGGQRARINLARAVYRSVDLYLLDDPLSAVDIHVGNHLFEKCIRDYLKDKTRILVTHQFQHLTNVDMIVVLNNGKIQNIGTFDAILNSGLDLAKLLPQSQEQAGKDTPGGKKRDSHLNNLSGMAAADNSVEQDGPKPQEMQEEVAKSLVQWGTYWSYVQASSRNVLFMVLVLFVTILSQVVTSCVDYWSRVWTSIEEYKMNIYYYDVVNTTILELNGSNYDLSTREAIAVYGSLIFLCVVLVITRSVLLFTFCVRASIKLHNEMFEKILRAKMWFFDTNPSGRILNRFSKDMALVDEQMPQAFLEVVQILLVAVGILVMILTVNYMMVVPVIMLAGLLVAMRAFYIPSAVNLKRLERIAKSPILTHLSASISGLATIRSCHAEQQSCKQFDEFQDSQTSCWYLFTTSSAAFGLWVDTCTTLFVCVLTFTLLLSPQGLSAADVGLALSQALILTTMVQYGIRKSTNIVSNITSVERILEYTHLDEEPTLESSPENKPSKEWPDKGCIQFLNLSLRYRENECPVLHNLSFEILPSQKVGIVGRTGAGKTSLISALYRLADLEGTILIDGVDIQTIGLHDLRQRISIIPQEPVLFSASLRYNLDPFNEFADHQLWNALEEVELKEAVGSLDLHVNEGGSNFSVGQRQLVCLARAILRNNRILVMDEATANVDPHTDSLIQKMIKTKFKHCTVLTIAHRVNTIMDSDLVVVMEAGTIVEMASPYVLLQDKNGHFYSMVEQTCSHVSGCPSGDAPE